MVSPVAMKDTLQLLLAEKTKPGQEVSRVQDPRDPRILSSFLSLPC